MSFRWHQKTTTDILGFILAFMKQGLTFYTVFLSFHNCTILYGLYREHPVSCLNSNWNSWIKMKFKSPSVQAWCKITRSTYDPHQRQLTITIIIIIMTRFSTSLCGCLLCPSLTGGEHGRPPTAAATTLRFQPADCWLWNNAALTCSAWQVPREREISGKNKKLI